MTNGFDHGGGYGAEKPSKDAPRNSQEKEAREKAEKQASAQSDQTEIGKAGSKTGAARA